VLCIVNSRSLALVFQLFLLAVFLLLSLDAQARVVRDPQLAELVATMARLPAEPPEDAPSRGAGPDLANAKHQLRDWIAFQLKIGDFSDARRGSAKSISAYLRHRLKAAGIGPFGISAWRSGPLVVVSTSFRIACGTDDSFYGWFWDGRSWVRSFAYERDDYAGMYQPLSLDSVRLAADGSSEAAGYYVLGSAVGTWCSSNWLGRMYQLFHVDGVSGRGALLADEDLFAFAAEGDRETELTADHAVIKYTGDTVDGRKTPMRDSLVMYRLSGGHASRVPMAAADAEDYAEKWLTAPHFIGNRSQLASWWQTLYAYMAKRESTSAEWSSTGPAARCRDDAKLLQFPLVFERSPVRSTSGQGAVPANATTESHTVYFLIRQDGRHSFSMQDIRSAPRKHCPVLEER